MQETAIAVSHRGFESGKDVGRSPLGNIFDQMIEIAPVLCVAQVAVSLS